MRAALKKERRTWMLPEPLRAQPGLEAYSPVFRQILHGRGVTQQRHLDPWLTAELDQAPDPFLLKDMAIACDLIGDAVRDGRRIAVYGDYDADGVTACATLARGLRAAGADVITYIPNRFTEGYGLNGEALRDLAGRGVTLVITCDCGTNSVDVARERPAGMRMIVTDHHEVGAERPPVDALINPKQPDCPYPFDGLAACGVAYKLLVALEQRGFPGTAGAAEHHALGVTPVAVHADKAREVLAEVLGAGQAPAAAAGAPVTASAFAPVTLLVVVEVNVLAPPTDWTVVKSTKFWVDEPVPPLAMERVPEERLPSASEETAPAPRADSLVAPATVRGPLTVVVTPTLPILTEVAVLVPRFRAPAALVSRP